jgi:hypothetical protein
MGFLLVTGLRFVKYLVVRAGGTDPWAFSRRCGGIPDPREFSDKNPWRIKQLLLLHRVTKNSHHW